MTKDAHVNILLPMGEKACDIHSQGQQTPQEKALSSLRTWMVIRIFFLVFDATATQASPRICLQVGITLKT